MWRLGAGEIRGGNAGGVCLAERCTGEFVHNVQVLEVIFLKMLSL